MIEKKNKVSIVFAGGAITGYYFESGCLKALKNCGINPDSFSGVSAGAIVSALAAYGEDPLMHDPFTKVKMHYFSLIRYIFVKWIENFFNSNNNKNFFNFPAEAIWDLDPLEDYLRKKLPKVEPKPLFITATNIDTGEIQVFTEKDDVPKVVRASCSLPGITIPPLINGNHYVDGIVSCCANINPVFESEIIICVNPITFNTRCPGNTMEKGLMDLLDQSFRIVNHRRFHDDIYELKAENKKVILIESKDCNVMSGNPLRKELKAQAVKSGYDHTLIALKKHAEWFSQIGIPLVFANKEKL